MDHLCDETLSAFLEGDLEPAESGGVAEHVAACTRCREAVADLRQLRDGARSLLAIEPPPRVWEAIQERVNRPRGIWRMILGLGRDPKSGQGDTIRNPRRVSVMSPDSGHVPRRWLWVGVPAMAAVVMFAFIFGLRSGFIGRTPLLAKAETVPTQAMAAKTVQADYAEYVRGIDTAISDCEDALRENPGSERVRRVYAGAQMSRRNAMDRLVSDGD